MKKLLLGSAALMMFSTAILIFQMSCKKDATAQTGTSNYILPPATTSTLGGVIVGNGLSVTGNGTLSVNSTGGIVQQNYILLRKYAPASSSVNEIWMANLDGSNMHQVPVTLPTGINISDEFRLTPNGDKIIFDAYGSGQSYIYSCNLDGSDLTQLIAFTNPPTGSLLLEGVY